MNPRIGTFAASVLAFYIGSGLSRGDARSDAIARATVAVEAAVPRAQSDPTRPIFHVISPAQWMNDPNGPIFYKGYYHLFYQLDPFSDKGGPKYWGHVRSRDLVKWEPLPIALWPSIELGEAEVWSGCCTINGEGKPMAFYTSIAPGQSPQTHSEQWAALGDDDLIAWHKSPANPVLSQAVNGATKIYEWRDPFIFQDHHRTFLVAGGNLNETKGGQAVVNIYEAQNRGLTSWKYRGVLFQLPDAEARTAECPNFFKLGGKWVLFVSPYGKVQYFVGEFDPETCRFHSESRGLLDNGPGFYAPNTMQVPDGRRIVWGWVNGFPGGHGWNGCLSLPRVLSLSRDGRLQQRPAPQLAKLRGTPVKWKNVLLNTSPKSFSLPPTNTLETEVDIDLKNAGMVTLGFKDEPISFSFDGAKFKFLNDEIPFALDGKSRVLRLRIFLDRSVLEIFANDELCATKVIQPISINDSLELSASVGDAKARLIKVWPMKTIW